MFNPQITLDDWQQSFLDATGDKILCTGRQVGKSVICGMDAGQYALDSPNRTVLMIAPTERQAFALFSKTLAYIKSQAAYKVRKGKHRPTKHKLELTNGTVVHCLPTGQTGTGIRFLTVDRLYVDECSRVPDDVFTAVTPMLFTTGGDMILLSTPAGCEGYFYDCWINRNEAFNSFSRHSIDSETAINNRKICKTWTKEQRAKAQQHLKREKARMTKSEYAQEYFGHFVEDLLNFFPVELIKSCMTVEPEEPKRHGDLFLGVDIARMGGDETVLTSVSRRKKKWVRMFDMDIKDNIRLTETIERIKAADKKHSYKKIYIDDGGLGAGVFDVLLNDSQTKRKVIAINNARRAINRDESRTKRLLKEDLYINLKRLMEKGRIALWNDPKILVSLKSIQYEYSQGKLRIFGKYTHIAEALIRAAWCMKDKSLNIWVRY